MDNDLKKRIDKLEKDLADLVSETYSNNFSALQDFNKFSRFNNRLKVPVYASDPATGEIGELICVGGKLKVCSSANTFTICGTQS